MSMGSAVKKAEQKEKLNIKDHETSKEDKKKYRAFF